jgi:undecaprenyl-diphosphatase
MIAATGYKLLKEYKTFMAKKETAGNKGTLLPFVAMLADQIFIGFLQKHGFKLFGIYRILVGIVLLVLIWKGIIK